MRNLGPGDWRLHARSGLQYPRHEQVPSAGLQAPSKAVGSQSRALLENRYDQSMGACSHCRSRCRCHCIHESPGSPKSTVLQDWRCCFVLSVVVNMMLPDETVTLSSYILAFLRCLTTQLKDWSRQLLQGMPRRDTSQRTFRPWQLEHALAPLLDFTLGERAAVCAFRNVE